MPKKAKQAKKKTAAKNAKSVARKRPAARAARAHAERRQPETLRLRSMSASLTVADLERSIAFYRDAVRFTLGERWEANGRLQGVEMRAGICDLMLNQDDFVRGRDRAKGEGVRLWASTAQDIDEMAARIKAMGGQLDYEPRRTAWGSYAFALIDPDGYKITIIQEE
ncbi:MAG TPA: VOC family protein [Gemmatimonadales bacterium]|nr:VOC family protein [Gemmatimonadales bacterium]